MLSTAVVAIALAVPMVLACRGASLLLLTPALATLAAADTDEGPMLGAVFGKRMQANGSAQVLAQGIVAHLGLQRAILAVILAGAVMSCGGVLLSVVALAVFPIATALFRQARLPKRQIPATIALEAFMFTMTALPGTPATANTTARGPS